MPVSTMSGTDIDPLSSDPAYSEVLETKASLSNHDHALERTTVNNEHAANSDKIEDAVKEARTKPIRIPVNTLALPHEDPEATPTAPSAFSLLAHTPTSSSSLRAEADDDKGDDVDNARSSHPVATDDIPSDTGTSPSQPQAGPSEPNKAFSVPVLRARLCRAAAQGDLETILSILHPSSPSAPNYPSSFTLVNSPTSSGLTPLLEAASHGHLNIVQHLIAEEGAVRDLEDYEGENAFLKASYRGHLDIMKYLAGDGDGDAANEGTSGEGGGTDINTQDREGWTALHNAASKGYLEVVMWLAENGASIDARSTQGYTPLMNAASKGHLPIIRYLLSRHSPDPFIRNSYHETAYDVAVATFELGIADTLANYEAQLWHDHQAQIGGLATPSQSLKPYNVLGMHVNVPIILYENQRLDLRWLSRAKRTISGPSSTSSSAAIITNQTVNEAFTSKALSRKDGHASSEIPPSYDGINPSRTWIPARRSDVGLPTILNPRQVRLPRHHGGQYRPSTPRRTTIVAKGKGTSTASSSGGDAGYAGSQPDRRDSTTSTISSLPEEAEPAWFWLTPSFFVDLSPADVDPEQGWQYARSFDKIVGDGDRDRKGEGEEAVEWSPEMPMELMRILAGEMPTSSRGVKWVRRRRWAKIMRRRLDIPHWGFDDDDDQQSMHEAGPTDEEQQHQQDLQTTLASLPMQDHLERARYFAGSHYRSHNSATATNSATEAGAKQGDDTQSIRSMQTVIQDSQGNGGDLDRAGARRVVARLERALTELREGMPDDEDEVRKLQAKVLAEIFEERLEDTRRQFPQLDIETHDDDAESFRYPGADEDSELDETSSISTSLRSNSLYSPISNRSLSSFLPNSDGASAQGSPITRQQATLRPDLTSISQQLSSNPDFRVPTSEVPPQLPNVPLVSHDGRTLFSDNARSTSYGSGSRTPAQTQLLMQRERATAQWEPDEATNDCRRCHRKFTFFLRKHHCRKCGLVVCAHCSSHTDYLRLSEVVLEPGVGSSYSNNSNTSLDPFYGYGLYHNEAGGFFRTCDACHEDLQRAVNSIDPDLLLSPNYFGTTNAHQQYQYNQQGSSAASSPPPTWPPSNEANFEDQQQRYEQQLDYLQSPTTQQQNDFEGSSMQRSVSDMSELGECPVCGTDLEEIPNEQEREHHVQTCLESGASARLQDNRYLVFALPESSPLVGTDCLICFESYEIGDKIGRLSCLCHFHRHCIANWLSRGKSCPVHAR